MMKYREIIAAQELLNLPERATMAEIKASYRTLLMHWHPDRRQFDTAACNNMTKRLTAAYKTILHYCEQYKYSFAKEEVKRYLSDEEWWLERFGNTPLWENADKS